jgi:glutamate 5-kinase
MMNPTQNPVFQAKRIVIKLGTQVVIREDGHLALDRLAQIVHLCAHLKGLGKEVLLVSSGAVGLGRNELEKTGPLSLSEKQACAAVGQGLLMETYRYLFSNDGCKTAQLLLTALDFSQRERYLNLKETLETLLKMGVIPIINENDSVSTVELKEESKHKSFGDNDKLSAIVASKLDADLLVIFTNVEGIYTDNPAKNPDAKRIPLVSSLDALNGIGVEGQSALGRGGMATKLEAAKIAALSGVGTLILSPKSIHALHELASQAKVPSEEEEWQWGTFVQPHETLNAKRRWIGLASGFDGVLTINEGAKQALIQKNASLLPVGIVGVQGEFQPKTVVQIQDEQGSELGRGLVQFGSEDIRKIQGASSKSIQEILGPVPYDVVIQRDYLVLFQSIENV